MAKSQPSFKMLITEVTVRLNARFEPSQRPMKVTPQMESGLTCQVLLRNNKDFALLPEKSKTKFSFLHWSVFTITLRDSSLMAKGTIMKFYICKLVYHRKLLLWNLEFSILIGLFVVRITRFFIANVLGYECEHEYG